MPLKHPKAWDRSNEVGAGFLQRIPFRPEVHVLVRSIIRNFDTLSEAELLRRLNELVRALAACFNPSLQVPVPEVVHHIRTKRSTASIRLTDDPVIRVDLRGPKPHDAMRCDLLELLQAIAHEMCHWIDFYVLNLPDSYHTAGFNARVEALLDRLLAA